MKHPCRNFSASNVGRNANGSLALMAHWGRPWTHWGDLAAMAPMELWTPVAFTVRCRKKIRMLGSADVHPQSNRVSQRFKLFYSHNHLGIEASVHFAIMLHWSAKMQTCGKRMLKYVEDNLENIDGQTVINQFLLKHLATFCLGEKISK